VAAVQHTLHHHQFQLHKLQVEQVEVVQVNIILVLEQVEMDHQEQQIQVVVQGAVLQTLAVQE
tara:strand:+ start:492 stop:680 length:189 start_codon:yes stop_codon:yes gene_type:complete